MSIRYDIYRKRCSSAQVSCRMHGWEKQAAAVGKVHEERGLRIKVLLQRDVSFKVQNLFNAK